jgi:AcrR family transcriptional regulator
MSESCQEFLDPRIRRTRQLLHQALATLLEEKEFEKISVHDIAEAATVNRATFYDHYADKFALLQCMVGARFQELLAARGIRFDQTCSSALKAIVLCVCDYLMSTPGMTCERQRHMQPHMESAVIGVVRWMILDGLRKHPAAGCVTPEILATTVSWAIYGAVKEWLQTPNRSESEEMAETVVLLVAPIFSALPAMAGTGTPL